MGPGNWFQVGDRLKKIAFDDRAFSNQDMYCYDALFDLASASAPFAQTDFTSELLLAWTRCGQDRPDAERWLLYRLLALEDEKRGGRRPLVEIEHDLERVHQEYVAGVYFGDLLPAAGGAAVAIDIDGVLETGWLGFSTITPAGAMSLRALLAHGFRPVLASGRSFAGVRDRCRLYGLAGAVAEYGAVAYDREQDASIELLAAAQLELLEQLRERLRGMPGVELDATYTRSVRAFVVAGGRRRRLDPERTRVALRGLETELRAVEGVAQTDFVPAVIDKAVGLRALLGDRPLELAVGDTSSDLPMLQMARVGRAPANADRAVHAAGVQVSSQPYQRGLAAAVSELIGHRPGACPACRRRALDGRASILELALSAQDRGRWGKAALTLLLALRVAR
jgi:hydroxymethylpyrimidine pyrophosphatase-like HAD family hydrolase